MASIPEILVLLGKVIELGLLSKIIAFKNPIDLYTDENGKRLFGLKFKTKKITIDKKDFKKGKKVYENWSDFKTDKISSGKLPDIKFSKEEKLKYIIYESDKFDGRRRKYKHDFEKSPTIQLNKSDNRFIVKKGNFIITERGIEG